MPEGHEVVFEGEADESPDWEPGNVVLRVRSKKEKGGWRRKETSLYWKETIGIDEVRDFSDFRSVLSKRLRNFPRPYSVSREILLSSMAEI
jgi:hypothetical protein